jgi:hypothetical protein
VRVEVDGGGDGRGAVDDGVLAGDDDLPGRAGAELPHLIRSSLLSLLRLHESILWPHREHRNDTPGRPVFYRRARATVRDVKPEHGQPGPT